VSVGGVSVDAVTDGEEKQVRQPCGQHGVEYAVVAEGCYGFLEPKEEESGKEADADFCGQPAPFFLG